MSCPSKSSELAKGVRIAASVQLESGNKSRKLSEQGTSHFSVWATLSIIIFKRAGIKLLMSRNMWILRRWGFSKCRVLVESLKTLQREPGVYLANAQRAVCTPAHICFWSISSVDCMIVACSFSHIQAMPYFNKHAVNLMYWLFAFSELIYLPLPFPDLIYRSIPFQDLMYWSFSFQDLMKAHRVSPFRSISEYYTSIYCIGLKS